MDLERLKLRAKAFEYLFDAVVVTDMQGIITDWNTGAQSLYGYSQQEIIGKPVSVLHVPEDSDFITAEVMSAIEEHGKWTGEIRMLHKQGDIGWIESVCVAITDDANQMIGALGINRDISSRRHREEYLLSLAHFDQLTDIPNRYLLLDRLNHLIEQSERNKTGFVLLYLDLDNFKVINDTRGHSVGDAVLQETAQILQKCIRHSDTVARFGGDEFVILLEEMNEKKNISMVTELLIEELHQPLFIDEEEIYITGSIGIATYPADGVTTDQLLSAADKAMYKAKAKGRDTFEF